VIQRNTRGLRLPALVIDEELPSATGGGRAVRSLAFVRRRGDTG